MTEFWVASKLDSNSWKEALGLGRFAYTVGPDICSAKEAVLMCAEQGDFEHGYPIADGKAVEFWVCPAYHPEEVQTFIVMGEHVTPRYTAKEIKDE